MCLMIFLEWVFFREEGLAGNGCRNTLKSQLFVLLGSLGIAQASWVTEREGNIAPPKLIGRNF